MKYLNILLVFALVAIVGSFLGWSPTLLFVASALAVIPAAGILGQATEEIALRTGPRLGGLLRQQIRVIAFVDVAQQPLKIAAVVDRHLRDEAHPRLTDAQRQLVVHR